MSASPAPLTHLGRYTLIRRLASGGMGEVYLGSLQGAANFTRQVAIKRILPHLARDTAFVSRFIDEANVTVQLHHGNIISVQELVEEAGELYLVMEYLPGRDLKAVIRRLARGEAEIEPDLALYIVAEILAGLDYAHHRVDDRGEAIHIVHRDVSPSNILLGAAGEVKLTDFGVARARGRLHQSLSGALQGKFVYMSPEQADGQPLDLRTDIYSVGLVLYELLTGVRPFAADTDPEVLRKVRLGEVAPPSTHRPDLTPAQDALIMRALARDPAARYPDAAAFQRAIRDHLAATGSDVGPRPLAQRLKALFPEGVVPSNEPEQPMSIDDALMAQLSGSASVGSAPSATFTRTGEDQPQTPSSRGQEAGPHTLTGHSPLPGPLPTDLQRADAPLARRPFYRLLVAGGVLGALITLGVIYWPGYSKLYVDILPKQAAASATITRGDIVVPPEAQPIEVRRRAPVEICAEAPGYARTCRSHTPDQSESRLTLTLPPMTETFTIKVMPQDPGEEVRVLIDDDEMGITSGAYVKLALDRDHTFRIDELPPGYTFTPITLDAEALRGLGRSEILLSLSPTAPAAP